MSPSQPKPISPAGPTTSSASTPEKTPRPSAASSVCERCGGSGFVFLPASPRYPNGAWTPCVCRQREARSRHLARMMAAAGLSAEIMRRWEFATFDPGAAVGSEAQRARLAEIAALCRAYAAEPSGWLILCGGYGCGKTHLAYAIAAQRLLAGREVFAIPVPDLLDQLRRGFDQHSRDDSFDRRLDAIRQAGLLILDDLGAENPTPWGAEKLYQIIDYRYVRRLPLVVTTNTNLYAPAGRVEPRVLSRLLDGADIPGGFSRLLVIPTGDYRRAHPRPSQLQ